MPETALGKPATALEIVRVIDDARGLEQITGTFDLCPYLYKAGGDDKTRAITSVGYAIINSIKGLDFFDARILEHTPDTVAMSLASRYYNSAGTLVCDVDVVEMNYRIFYQRMRATWNEKKWDEKQRKKVIVRQAEITTTYNEAGDPIQRIVLPPEIERELYAKILWLRQKGVHVLMTVLKNRLIKQATGLKSVPAPQTDSNDNDIGPVPVLVVGYRPIGSREVTAAVNDLYGATCGATPRPREPAEKEITDTMKEAAIDGDDLQTEVMAATIQNGAGPDPGPPGLNLEPPARQTPAAPATPGPSPTSTVPPPPDSKINECTGCRIKVTSEKVQAYSKRVYGMVLCMKCQNKRKEAAPK